MSFPVTEGGLERFSDRTKAKPAGSNECRSMMCPMSPCGPKRYFFMYTQARTRVRVAQRDAGQRNLQPPECVLYPYIITILPSTSHVRPWH